MTRNIDAWGDPRRHYAVTEVKEIGLRSNERWEHMVEKVVPDCREAVKRAVSRWNRKIRIQLSNEIGFQLKGALDSSAGRRWIAGTVFSDPR